MPVREIGTIFPSLQDVELLVEHRIRPKFLYESTSVRSLSQHSKSRLSESLFIKRLGKFSGLLLTYTFYVVLFSKHSPTGD